LFPRLIVVGADCGGRDWFTSHISEPLINVQEKKICNTVKTRV